MDPFSVPEKAIESFERLTATRVTVHDLRGSLRPFLSPERFAHAHPLCAALKINHSQSCIAFDITRLRRELPELPDGRVQVCFAGIVEFVVPSFQEHTLEWVLFAGPRSIGPRLSCAARDEAPPPRKSPWPRGTPMAKAVNDDEAQIILENLRQLAARLRVWSTELAASGFESRRLSPPLEKGRQGGSLGTSVQPRKLLRAQSPYNNFPDELAHRRTLIRSFIHTHHTQPVRLDDLANVLHLSESRAGHAVKEACGSTFLKLLTEARLRTAAGLLQHTSIAILDVALRSGFGEVSHFHRSFRERFKTTPLQYRKQSESARQA